MGLFDKFIKRKDDDSDKNNALAKKDDSTAMTKQDSIETAIAERMKNTNLTECIKVSFGDIAALGTGFSQFIPSLRKVTMDGVGYLPINMLPGDHLKMNKAGTFYWGSHIDADGKSVMTKWVKAGPTTAALPIDPATLMMAAMLANVEKKLDNIAETQMKILSFLELDKQAEQQGNMNVLTDIMNGYKYNWDNQQYLQNNHMKVLDIKQASEKNVIFYQEQIAGIIKSIPMINVDQGVRDSINKLEKQFQNYRTALYLYAMSSFLDVMLLGNFREEYLEQVATKVCDYNDCYHKHITDSQELVKKMSNSSIETQVVSGLGNASKALGKFIASNPVLSKGPVDEWLQDSGNKLIKGNKDKVAKFISLLTSDFDTGSESFVDSIRQVKEIANHTKGLIIDGETIYLEKENQTDDDESL